MDFSVDEAKARLARMGPQELAELDRLIADESKKLWLPDPGNRPQQAAYNSKASLILFGGAAGGGKTDLIIGTALTAHVNSVIFRRQSTDLRGIEERLLAVAGRDGWNGQLKALRRGKQLIELGHLDKPGSEESWRGRPHDFVGFDEGSQLSRYKVQFVMGWLRSANPRQRRRAIIASNPPTSGEGLWLIEWFAPWLDTKFHDPAEPGELRYAVTAPDQDGTTLWTDGPEKIKFVGSLEFRKATAEEIARNDPELITPQSRTFIPSFLRDNRYLSDTGYRGQLQSLPEPLRSQLLHGDFLVGRMDHEWQVIPTNWVRAAQDRWRPTPPDGAVMSAIAVDVAQGGADRTVLQARYGPWFAPPLERPGVETPTGAEVAALVIMQRRDGAQVIIDFGGGYGGAAKLRLGDNEVPSIPFNGSGKTSGRTADKQLTFVNRRAEAHWRLREALDPDQPHGSPLALPPDPQVLADLTAPRWKLTPNGIRIEEKDELRKPNRLGRSPDKGDAIVMAWSEGERAMRIAHRRQLRTTALRIPGSVGKSVTSATGDLDVRDAGYPSDRGTGWMGH